MGFKTKFSSLIDVVEFKESVREEIGRLLDNRSRVNALRDYHAKRRPRPCGMTVHTGIGCDYMCSYCYIIDMGFKWGVKPYPLSGLELVYALASNPFFVPGPNGTLIAIGSVTEPFLEKTREKTFEYIEAISKFLGNPIQFSTKSRLSIDEAKRLRSLDPGISPLVTIVTMKYNKVLEPKAPSPEERLETIENLARAGLKPILFYRPIIPGISEKEYREVLEKAKKSGAIGVVAGSLRITKRILTLLHNIGFNTDEILRRARKLPRGAEQVDIDTTDIKKKILDYARSIGLETFPMACMANIYTHNKICYPMITRKVISRHDEFEKPPEIVQEEIIEVAKHLKVEITRINITSRMDKIVIEVRGDREKAFFLEELVKTYFKTCVKVLTKRY